MKNTKANIDYFQVKDFAKTMQAHHSKIVKLQDEYQIEYDDVMNSDTWSTIETMVNDRLYEGANKRNVATMINGITRQVIGNILEYHEVNRRFDTAFYMSHYMKIREGMADILGNFEDRGQI